MNPQHQQKRIIRQSCHHKFYPQPLFNFSYNRPTFAFTSESGHTLGSRRKIAHKGTHGETGGISDGGWYRCPRSVPHVRKPPRAGYQTGVLCRFWVLAGGALPKNAESLRDSDALMRVAVPRRRGPAGPRDLFRFCRSCGLYTLRSGPFRVCEARGGITTLGALYVLLKRRTAACQNGSFAVFCGRAGVVPRTIPIFLRIHRIFCWQFQLQTLLRYGTISSANLKLISNPN